MFCLCFFHILHLFFNSNSVSFVEGGQKNISCPRAQGTLATPLPQSGGYVQSGDYLNTDVQFLLQKKLTRKIWCVRMGHGGRGVETVRTFCGHGEAIFGDFVRTCFIDGPKAKN